MQGKLHEEAPSNDAYRQFDAAEFLKRRFSAPKGIIDEERGVQLFYLQSYHDFYQNLPPEWDAGNARLLELGGGPVVYPLISAAPHVSEIVFTDYAESNREQVRLWRNRDPIAHDWSPYFQHVVNGLEGIQRHEAPSQRQEELRCKIRAILPCNVLEDRPEDIIAGGTYSFEPFDIVSSDFCFEIASESHEIYLDTLRKVKALLGPRGFLASLVAENQSWYVNGSTRFSNVPFTAQEIRDYHSRAGFTIQYSTQFNIPEAGRNTISDCEGTSFIVARIAA